MRSSELSRNTRGLPKNQPQKGTPYLLFTVLPKSERYRSCFTLRSCVTFFNILVTALFLHQITTPQPLLLLLLLLLLLMNFLGGENGREKWRRSHTRSSNRSCGISAMFQHGAHELRTGSTLGQTLPRTFVHQGMGCHQFTTTSGVKAKKESYFSFIRSFLWVVPYGATIEPISKAPIAQEDKVKITALRIVTYFNSVQLQQVSMEPFQNALVFRNVGLKHYVSSSVLCWNVELSQGE